MRAELAKLRSDAAQARGQLTLQDEHKGPVAQDSPSLKLSYWQLKDNDVHNLTSLASRLTIEALSEAIRLGVEERAIKLPVGENFVNLETQVVITLTKLRRNDPYQIMPITWGLCHVTIQKIVTGMIKILHGLLYERVVKSYGVPTLNENLRFLPASFEEDQSVRLILDCFDLKIGKPENPEIARQTYSPYRAMNSFKFLLGISPTGLISFVSEAFGGRASDDDICDLSDVWRIFEEGDSVYVDKGFRGSNAPSHINITAPTFRNKNVHQLNLCQVKSSRSIAKLRSHVERAVRRIKTFKILHNMPYAFQK
jgi:hypothetical protein